MASTRWRRVRPIPSPTLSADPSLLHLSLAHLLNWIPLASSCASFLTNEAKLPSRLSLYIDSFQDLISRAQAPNAVFVFVWWLLGNAPTFTASSFITSVSLSTRPVSRLSSTRMLSQSSDATTSFFFLIREGSPSYKNPSPLAASSKTNHSMLSRKQSILVSISLSATKLFRDSFHTLYAYGIFCFYLPCYVMPDLYARVHHIWLTIFQ